MRIWLPVLLSVAFAGCKSEQKNRSDAYVPGAQQCVTVTDPACTGEVAAGAQVPLPEIMRDKSLPSAETSIFGRCEMEVEGEKKLRPCDSIQLFVRATRENEQRTAVFNGYDFKFEGLSQSTYNVIAASPKYDLSTDTKVLNRGSTVKLRVRAKPKK
jgi:hypothetical protein